MVNSDARWGGEFRVPAAWDDICAEAKLDAGYDADGRSPNGYTEKDSRKRLFDEKKGHWVGRFGRGDSVSGPGTVHSAYGPLPI